MNKYKLEYVKTEYIPKKINDVRLNKLFFRYKVNFKKQNDYVKFKDLNNKLCKTIILHEFSDYPEETRNFLKEKIIDKIDKSYVNKDFIIRICNSLLDENYEEVNLFIKNYSLTGLIKKGELIEKDNKVLVEITLNDDSKVKFSNVNLPKGLIDSYNGYCHQVVESFTKDIEKSKAAFVLENNELCGKYYHSILMIDNIVYDLAHNVLMSFDNYKKLFNPEIIFIEDSNDIVKGIANLKTNEKFIDCDYGDYFKYGLSKKMRKNL